MHSLETITRVNNIAFAKGPTEAVKNGLFVVCKYDGLHLSNYYSFASQAEAEAFAETQDAERFPDERYTLSYPVPARGQLMAA